MHDFVLIFSKILFHNLNHLIFIALNVKYEDQTSLASK